MENVKTIRRKRILAHMKWASLAALKLTQGGQPTQLNDGYAMICAKIRLLRPDLSGTRHGIIAAFVGEGAESEALNTAYKLRRRERRLKRKQKPVSFYETDEWRTLRYKALLLHGGACQCCGATAKDGVKLHVDHVKPRSKFPELELTLTNLQVLCEVCNLGKSNRDQTDWRPNA